MTNTPLPARAALALALAAGLTGTAHAQGAEEAPFARYVSATPAPQFDSADAAVEALRTALTGDDFDGLAALLGLDAAALRDSPDTVEAYAQMRRGAEARIVTQDQEDRVLIDIGWRLWPLPFPVVKAGDGSWAFDTRAGLDEIVNRHVGENELAAIDTVHAYLDAQVDYAAVDRDGDGVLEYAQTLVSTPGMTDGLYWPETDEDGPSPAGEGINTAELDDASAGRGYFGYHFRILTGQGDNIAGGAYDYVINGNMIAGYAILAWPAHYGESGVHSFVANQQGVLYEADLGPETDRIVPWIERFNPGEAWELVPE
ncbi:DUF2950 domain-containing protein (plasmid) [Paroceanicella profunda]|uniref:DUF2950 domain-containing protein n=1 Tax=Paroceanicella profunda TaxID=2579971 RepID=A0A5B8G5V9_9RHOB|nr:DUF2950 family protein [Paroceanicella profunda]QDL94433.1 DUF2950 domain-containing protein [Paroceanicella profunda]